jgi:thiol peroxidase
MATITLRGNPIHTSGELPAVGHKAPDFKLTGTDLKDVSLESFAGKKKILNIFPSIDTPVCATSTRHFNVDAAKIPGVAILTVSADLPFALKRFCAAEGIGAVSTLSEMRTRDFGHAYGVQITDGPMAGLLARAVVVVDEHDKVVYTELVPEIAQEPDYEKALAAAR